MSEPRVRWVEKFGKHGKFDAYDGRPSDRPHLEPFVDRYAYDALAERLKACERERDEWKYCAKKGDDAVELLTKQKHQALERVRELEAENKADLHTHGEVIDALREQVAEYEDALEYYASCYNCGSDTRVCTARHDEAREVLEKWGKK